MVWIELIPPWEEKLRRDYDLKQVRYNQLAFDLREGTHVGGIRWKVFPLCIEVRVPRGHLQGASTEHIAGTLGLHQERHSPRPQTEQEKTGIGMQLLPLPESFCETVGAQSLMGASIWNCINGSVNLELHYWERQFNLELQPVTHLLIVIIKITGAQASAPVQRSNLHYRTSHQLLQQYVRPGRQWEPKH